MLLPVQAEQPRSLTFDGTATPSTLDRLYAILATLDTGAWTNPPTVSGAVEYHDFLPGTAWRIRKPFAESLQHELFTLVAASGLTMACFAWDSQGARINLWWAGLYVPYTFIKGHQDRLSVSVAEGQPADQAAPWTPYAYHAYCQGALRVGSAHEALICVQERRDAAPSFATPPT